MRRRDVHALKTDRREDCVQMPEKTARSAARQPFGLPQSSVSSACLARTWEKRKNSCQLDSHPGNTGWTDFDGTHFRIAPKKTKRTKGTEMRIKAPQSPPRSPRARARARPDAQQRRAVYGPVPVQHDAPSASPQRRLSARDKGVGKTSESYSAHGLRKNAGIMLAENGATVSQIMAALGHTTPKLALYYRRLANQRTLNDQAVAIVDGVFERRLAERRRAARAKLKVVNLEDYPYGKSVIE
jgi:hypothetical protein